MILSARIWIFANLQGLPSKLIGYHWGYTQLKMGSHPPYQMKTQSEVDVWPAHHNIWKG